LDRAGSLAAFRVVQESLTNVVKHAGRDASASVRFTWIDGGLDIAVTDDGVGPRKDEGGQGLAGMRERVAHAGGRMSALGRGGQEGRGFTVSAYLPARAREESR
jgi:signal transduction histidine kinase